MLYSAQGANKRFRQVLFLIDGLDEYNGDHQYIVDLLKGIVSQTTSRYAYPGGPGMSSRQRSGIV
jgi:hypothetical protein